MSPERELLSLSGRLDRMVAAGNLEAARSVADAAVNTKAFATIRKAIVAVSVGSLSSAEVILGAAARADLLASFRWYLVLAVLSRRDMPLDSPMRVSLLALASKALGEDTEHCPPSLFGVPGLIQLSLESLGDDASDLVAEQTIDFISTWSNRLAEYAYPRHWLTLLKTRAKRRLRAVDDVELRREWQREIGAFVQAAPSQQQSDGSLAAEIGEIVNRVFSTSVTVQRVRDGRDAFERYLLSMLTALSSDERSGLTIAVRVDAQSRSLVWGELASQIDRLERFIQELADEFSQQASKLLEFTPRYAAPGSWTIVLSARASEGCSAAVVKALQDEQVEARWLETIGGLPPSTRVHAAVLDDRDFSAVALKTEMASGKHGARGVALRLMSRDVPQADKLSRVRTLTKIASSEHGESFRGTRKRFLAITDITARQFSYYFRAASMLGLVGDRGRATGIGRIVANSDQGTAIQVLKSQFLASGIGSAWVLWSQVGGIDFLKPDTAEEFLKDCSPSLSASTRKRRANTLRAWLDTFKTGRFDVDQ
jgi:hypothetical protein